MITIIYNEDITLSTADVVVNTSNGQGYMGGKWALDAKRKGVAKSIQYLTRGKVEKLAKAECEKHGIFGYRPGSIFLTAAPNMQTTYILHAVTMRYPGCNSKIKTIDL